MACEECEKHKARTELMEAVTRRALQKMYVEHRRLRKSLVALHRVLGTILRTGSVDKGDSDVMRMLEIVDEVIKDVPERSHPGEVS